VARLVRIEQGQEELSQGSAGSGSAVSELRFLVVEDQGFQLWMLGKMLEDLGARYVFSAADGAKALQVIAEREPPIDVIITDVDMPGMDGMEFMRHLGAAGNSASVILASALEPRLLGGIETMARAYHLNVLGVISKPVTARKLEALIASHGSVPRMALDDAAPSIAPAELADGIRRREFVAYFQPQVDLVTRAVKGVEALARWRHRGHVLVRPQHFIGAIEQAGLMKELTVMILWQAVAECIRWRAAGIDATVSVNVSAASLGDIEFGEELYETVLQGALEPRHVVLEVTETSDAADWGALLENLSRLRMRGFGLSIDDYGTGHSSMERLAGVPFTELKIDQSFVRRALSHEPSRAMLESGIEMAKKLRITPVAEGIEGRVEWELVRSLGCELAQGYYIKRPVEAMEFHEWLNAARRTTA
jgi:EAL domain-containing protein (putative c-di-GMP-specific phosphodiesterase class I)/AmiR/NasT family two-component response regulator